MARPPIKRKPAPKEKGAKPSTQTPPGKTWKTGHPMAPTPMKPMTTKRPKQ